MSACILVDTGFGQPPTPEQMAEWEQQERAAGRPAGRWRGPAHRTEPNRVYPTEESALVALSPHAAADPREIFI